MLCFVFLFCKSTNQFWYLTFDLPSQVLITSKIVIILLVNTLVEKINTYVKNCVNSGGMSELWWMCTMGAYFKIDINVLHGAIFKPEKHIMS